MDSILGLLRFHGPKLWRKALRNRYKKNSQLCCITLAVVFWYGCFRKLWYPQISQIIHFNRVFDYFHHPFWGIYPYFWKHPYIDELCLLGIFIKTKPFQKTLDPRKFPCLCHGQRPSQRAKFARVKLTSAFSRLWTKNFQTGVFFGPLFFFQWKSRRDKNDTKTGIAMQYHHFWTKELYRIHQYWTLCKQPNWMSAKLRGTAALLTRILSKGTNLCPQIRIGFCQKPLFLAGPF